MSGINGEPDRRIIGYQIVCSAGYNIHGESDDPFGLNSFDVLCDGAVDAARNWAADKGYRVVEVLEGDVEEPEFVSEIRLQAQAGMRF